MQGHINSMANECAMENTPSNANETGVADTEHKGASWTTTHLLARNYQPPWQNLTFQQQQQKSPNLANTMEMMPFSSPWTKSNIQQTLYIQTYSFTDMFLKCQISILDLKAKKQAWVAGTHWARLLDLSTCPSPQGCMIFPEAYQLSQMSSTTAVNKTPVPFRVGQLAKEWTFYHILLEFPFCASFSVVESVICVRARSVKANKENLTTTTKKKELKVTTNRPFTKMDTLENYLYIIFNFAIFQFSVFTFGPSWSPYSVVFYGCASSFVNTLLYLPLMSQ